MAKVEGERLAQSKQRINDFKKFIEAKRMKRCAAGISLGQDEMKRHIEESDEEENKAYQQLTIVYIYLKFIIINMKLFQEKEKYKSTLNKLHVLKKEIDNLKLYMENYKKQIKVLIMY